ncbi:CYTH domain-containing protein [Psychroflexus aestuariivivens]|uniref:CYTH domain-containing protein n=1 Tax=Psychroflexus aestuariivivens TaxID=1795040 RepID=UPI000FD80336|nr:CYTH domain-containing protein [Psychroflexus aestuariivivens]
MQEIERKFLVTSSKFKEEAYDSKSISQGFLNSHKVRTVRVRIYGNSGFLTIKGESTADGTSRFEWEQEIPVEEAKSLLKLCEPGIIEKTRFLVKKGKHIFEIDEFYGENEGLIVAEVELNSADEKFQKPNWLGTEVTGNPKYYNSVLSKNPYTNWT